MNRPDLLADTDLCVKCGLCLPHCPTYLKTQDENESPRGRLSLIQGWAKGALAATPELARHVDGCLLCRACESACPAYVPYSNIVDRFRAEVGEMGKPLAARLKSAAVRKLLVGGAVRRRAEALLAAPAGTTARRWLGSAALKPMGLDALTAGLPAQSSAAQWTGTHPAEGGPARAQVDVFLGCTANLFDAETVAAAIRVLNRLGVEARVPERQGCCGALHAHAGDAATASELMGRNLAAFDGAAPVVGFASGCGAMLRDYLAAGTEAAAQFAARFRDISQFLAELPWPDGLELKPLRAKVCVHAPCSLKNALRAERYPLALLRRIPELNPVALPAQARCCGAAGSYLLEHPGMAQELRDDVLEQVLALQPECLVTSNPGCAMHLRAGLKQRGRGDIEVLHPVALLARQLP